MYRPQEAHSRRYSSIGWLRSVAERKPIPCYIVGDINYWLLVLSGRRGRVTLVMTGVTGGRRKIWRSGGVPIDVVFRLCRHWPNSDDFVTIRNSYQWRLALTRTPLPIPDELIPLTPGSDGRLVWRSIDVSPVGIDQWPSIVVRHAENQYCTDGIILFIDHSVVLLTRWRPQGDDGDPDGDGYWQLWWFR